MDELQALIDKYEAASRGPSSVPTAGPPPPVAPPVGTSGAPSAASGGLIPEPLGPVDNSQEVPLGAGASPTSDVTHIDRNFPQFHKSVTNHRDGQKLDMYKYLQVHEQAEKAALDKGASIDDAHREATDAEKQSLEADGGSWNAYSTVIKGYLKTSEREHPAHAPPVMPQQQAGAPGQPGQPSPDSVPPGVPGPGGPDIDALIKQYEAAGAGQPQSKGATLNYLAGVSGRAAEVMGEVNMPERLAQVAKTIPQEGLMAAGQEFLTGNKSKKQFKDALNLLGINTEPEKGSMMGEIGRQTVDALLMTAAIYTAAPAMAARAGFSTKDYLIRSLGEAAQKHPYVGLVSMVTGGVPGTVIGEEYGGPAGGFAGGVAGSLGALGPMWLGRKVGQVSTKLLGKVADVIDNFAAKMGSQNTPIPGLQKPKAPGVVPDDILDTYRLAEEKARAAGDEVMSAHGALMDAKEKLNPEAIAAAEKRFAAAKIAETGPDGKGGAVKEADDAWFAIPKDARGKYSREVTAIRSDFSDTNYPKQFAQEQIEGDLKTVNQHIEDAMKRVRPTEGGTAEDFSVKIAEGVVEAERTASRIEGKYWERAPLDERMTDRQGPLEDLDSFMTDVRGRFNAKMIPEDEVKGLYRLFATQGGEPGKFQPLPTVRRLRAEASAIAQTRRSEMAAEAPNDQKIANLTRLESMINRWIGEAFPDNVPLQQARAFSTAYHDMFSRSEMFQLIRQGMRGQDRVRPEDVLEKLLSRRNGLADLYSMTERLLSVGPGENRGLLGNVRVEIPGYPRSRVSTINASRNNTITGTIQDEIPRPDVGINAAEQNQLRQLQQDASNGIRQMFQDEVSTHLNTIEPEPAKAAQQVAKIIERWTPRIEAFSKDVSEIQMAMTDALTGVQQRRAIEDSTLRKYLMSNDIETAVNRIWSSSDPVKVAHAIMNGEAGIGGFAHDPRALEGFRAAMTDKLADKAKNDPRDIIKLLSDSRNSRLMRSVLGEDRYNRVVSVAENLVKMEDDPNRSKFVQAAVYGARWAAVKVAALVPNFGKGGELQQAALFSEIARKYVMGKLNGGDPTKLFSEAIRNPAVERLLTSKIPSDGQSANQMKLLLKRVLRFNAGMNAMYNAAAGSTGGQGPDPSEKSSEYLPQRASSLQPTDRIVTEGIPVRQPRTEPVPSDKDFFNQLNKIKINPQALEAMPGGAQIEDRRLSDKTLQGYKGITEAADAEGLSQFRPARAFVRRAPPPGIDYNPATDKSNLPLPRNNPFRMTETRKGYVPPEYPEAGPRATGGGGTANPFRGHPPISNPPKGLNASGAIRDVHEAPEPKGTPLWHHQIGKKHQHDRTMENPIYHAP